MHKLLGRSKSKITQGSPKTNQKHNFSYLSESFDGDEMKLKGKFSSKKTPEMGEMVHGEQEVQSIMLSDYTNTHINN